MWEDRSNKCGGRWLITLSKQQRHTELDRFWLDTVSERSSLPICITTFDSLEPFCSCESPENCSFVPMQLL